MTAAPQSCQPEITLVQDLRMDADMLKDGYQKGLTELWHSETVTEAAKNALRAADRIEELTKALEPFAKYELRMVAFAGSVKPADWKDFVWAAGLTGAQPEFRHFDNARRTLALSLEQSGSGK